MNYPAKELQSALFSLLARSSFMSDVKLTAEQFLVLAKPEQRIVIAKDVLDMLRMEQIYAEKGDYFYTTSINARDREINEIVGKSECYACAIGGLFVAEVMYTDKAKVKDATSSFMKERLSSYFEESQLRLIEAAFEGYSEFATEKNRTNVEYSRAVNYRWAHKIYTSKDAMISIMENIIENKGDFVP